MANKSVTKDKKLAKEPESPALTEYIHQTPGDFDKFLFEIYRKKYNKRHFLITVDEKDGHPWQHRIFDTPHCLVVNDEKGKTMFLKRNTRYFFTFHNNNDSNHELFFTTDPAGGKKGDQTAGEYEPGEILGTPRPFAEFKSVSFIITNTFPKVFYYQDRQHKFLGGMIFIVDDAAASTSAKKEKKEHHSKERPKHHSKSKSRERPKHHSESRSRSKSRERPKHHSRSRSRSTSRDRPKHHSRSRSQERPKHHLPTKPKNHSRGRSEERPKHHGRSKSAEHRKHSPVKIRRAETPPPPKAPRQITPKKQPNDKKKANDRCVNGKCKR